MSVLMSMDSLVQRQEYFQADVLCLNADDTPHVSPSGGPWLLGFWRQGHTCISCSAVDSNNLSHLQSLFLTDSSLQLQLSIASCSAASELPICADSLRHFVRLLLLNLWKILAGFNAS